MTLILNGTTGVSGVDGSAATPAFQGNDANTGISFGTDIVTINTGGQARVTTDASGNVGVGTASNLLSAASRVTVSINGASSAALAFGTTDTRRGHFYCDSSELAIASAAGSINFQTAGNTQATINASGNVGIGVTPSAWDSTRKAIQVGAGGALVGNTGAASSVNLNANIYFDGTNNRYIGTGFASIYAQSNGAHTWFNAPSGTAGNTISFTQAMTLKSSGDLFVGTTSGDARLNVTSSSGNDNVGSFYVLNTNAAADACIAAFATATNSTATSNVFIKFGVNSYASACGQINANGTGAAAFGSFSDRRLKENIADLSPQLPNILALRPVEFDYIESEGGGHQIGFVAQEMQEVYSDAVGERSDGMLTVTGWSKTEARLVKAIQELKNEVDALKGAQNV